MGNWLWFWPLGLTLASAVAASLARGDTATLVYDKADPRVSFAAGDLAAALRGLGLEVRVLPVERLDQATERLRVVVATLADKAAVARLAEEKGKPPADLQPEGFGIRKTTADGSTTLWTIGADDAGAMYGALELAEALATGGLEAVREGDHNPWFAMRGTKFNIPLDARTPSYSDLSDAGQKNIPVVWDLDFWKSYIDHLARFRYNFVSLWSLHPFPSLVRVPEYPEVALDDVMRARGPLKEFHSLNGRGFDAPEILGNLQTVKKMTMDEKIAFWREVMRYGRDRNVAFYIVTWNIFVNGTGGKYGITASIGNETTADYFRKSVRALFRTYPLLAGIGLTTGENMPRASQQEKERWAFRTYGLGVLEALAEQPDRRITFIHRQHQTGAPAVIRVFKPLIEHPRADFIFSFKYAKAHVYSATRQPYHRRFVEEIGDLKTIWTLRNDDVYHFRWGAPGFVREFIRNIPHEHSRGFYLGSDQYIWGREFLSTEPQVPGRLEVGKHWYHWMLWGRLGYDPQLPDERFVAILARRFPGVSARDLFAAWQHASMIYPITTGFHWGALDFQWYIEACKSHPRVAGTKSGFNTLERFITLEPHPESGYVSIPDYVRSVTEGKEVRGVSPLEVSRRLHSHAKQALAILERLKPGGDKELRLTLGDIRAMAYLGKYYAHKIRGATELALFRASHKPDHRAAAVAELNKAAGLWRLYASTALTRYRNPVWMNRVGHCDWRSLYDDVLADVRLAGGEPRPPSMEPTPGGRIHEAEAARFAGGRKVGAEGATGGEALDFAHAPPAAAIEWTVETPRRGTFLLEVRYTRVAGKHPADIAINGRPAGAIVLWTTGGEGVWAWDRVPVTLRAGKNVVRLEPRGGPVVDHLNVLPGEVAGRGR